MQLSSLSSRHQNKDVINSMLTDHSRSSSPNSTTTTMMTNLSSASSSFFCKLTRHLVEASRVNCVQVSLPSDSKQPALTCLHTLYKRNCILNSPTVNKTTQLMETYPFSLNCISHSLCRLYTTSATANDFKYSHDKHCLLWAWLHL